MSRRRAGRANDTAFMDRLHSYVPGWDFPKLDPRRHLTNHFGLVSDFLSESFTRLRTTSRANVLDGRVHFGGALSGRDIEAVRKSVSGLIKLLYPNPSATVPDADLEWIVRLALEGRRRVKEQQRRVFKSEFRNTHFSYTLGAEGVETFVATPELQSDQAVESDPLPPGQVWAIAPGSAEAGAGLFRIEVSHQPGSGVRILNHPAPPPFRESVKVGEQIPFTQARSLVGDRDPRAQEFTLQLRAIDADKNGGGLGVAVLTALCGSLLGRNSRGGTILVGSATLGGSIELVANAVQVAELAVEKQAQTLLMPISARRQLNELPDDFWTKLNIEFYRDAPDAVFKALEE
jgi:ATP-dependent Lon protease